MVGFGATLWDLEKGLVDEKKTEAIPLLPLHAARHESPVLHASSQPHESSLPHDSSLPHAPSRAHEPPAPHESLPSVRWSLSEEPRAGPSRAPDEPAAAGDCYDARDNVNKALWKAVKERDPLAVKELLVTWSPLAENLPVCSLLHWCLDQYPPERQPETEPSCVMEIITELLNASTPDVVNCLEHKQDVVYPSLLRQAINLGNMALIQMLLERGASVTRVTKCGETALHRATKYPDILRYFLDNFDIQNSSDDDGLAPIHWAAVFNEPESMKVLLERFGEEQLAWTTRNGYVNTAWHKIVDFGSNKVAEFLLQSQYRNGVNVRNEDGETPFYLSASYGYKFLTSALLRMDSFLSDKANGKMVVEQLVKNVNEPLKLLEDTFDEFIYNEGRVIIADLYFLADYGDSSVSQIDVIKELVRWGQSKILVHPLIESLLCLRWNTLLPVFYTMLTIYAAFLIPFNIYLVNVFYKSDANATNASCPSLAYDTESCVECYDSWGAWLLLVLIYLSIFLMLAQECIYICLRKLQYFVHMEAWLKLSVLALGAAVVALLRCAPAPAPWQRHVACLALLLAWLQAMLLLLRFPRWGYYVVMFERTLMNIFKVFATSVCLIVGFSLCFMIQYQSKPPFDGPLSALVKTLVMMSSEFDYGDLFGEDHEELEGTRTVVRLLFVLFVVFVAIVLMNFMIGVAVNDVNELNVIGNIRRLEKQVELLSNLEVVGNTVLGKWWQRLSRVRYHYTITNNLECNKKWEVVSIGHDIDADQYAQTLPLELKEALMDVVKKKQSAKKEKEAEQEKENKLNALYDAVVGTHDPDKDNDYKSGPNKKASSSILTEKITSLEDGLTNVKKAHEELNGKLDELQGFMKEISGKLAVMADALSSIARDGDTSPSSPSS